MDVVTRKKQLVSFKTILKALNILCVQQRSGIMYIYTNESRGATFTLAQGRIVGILYGSLRGMDALKLLKKVVSARFIFKNDINSRDKQRDETEYLPANNVIFNQFGIKTITTSFDNQGEIKNILVVDDSAMSRKVITNVFADKSYQITEAKDGFDAMDKLSIQTPDLVLLDLILPKMDGYQVLQAMKKDNNYKNIPVIMLTSRDALLDKLKGKMSATDEYLTKPVNPEMLLKKVQKHLQQIHS